MITRNAINEANLAMTEAIENWIPKPTPNELFCSNLEWYKHEELVARGQILPIAEEL